MTDDGEPGVGFAPGDDPSLGGESAGLLAPRPLTIVETVDPITDRLLAEYGKPLSAAERKVLEALVTGATYAQIGHLLGISEQTVKNHVSAMLAKSGARTALRLLWLYAMHRMDEAVEVVRAEANAFRREVMAERVLALDDALYREQQRISIP